MLAIYLFAIMASNSLLQKESKAAKGKGQMELRL